MDWHCSEDCLGRSAAIERKPTPFYILSLSRSLPPHRLAAFGLDYPLLAGGEKRTVIRPGANGGRRRPRKEQDDMPLRTLRRGERRRRLVHGLVPFFSGSETRRRASTLSCHLLRASRRCEHTVWHGLDLARALTRPISPEGGFHPSGFMICWFLEGWKRSST